jgi:hypothetical protein
VPEVAVAEVPVTEVAITVVVKPAKPVAEEVAAAKTAEGDPVAAEAMEATKAVATKMEATEAVATSASMASTATATTSAAGVGDLGQRDDHGDQHSKHQIEQLTTHDTLLLQTFLSIHLRHTRARMMAKLRRCLSYLSQLLRRPPAPRPRHDGIAGITMFDHMPIGAFADRRPRRLDLDAQRRPALDARAGLIVLCRNRPGHPANRKGERRKPDDPCAHGLSSLERATLPHCGGNVNRQSRPTSTHGRFRRSAS